MTRNTSVNWQISDFVLLELGLWSGQLSFLTLIPYNIYGEMLKNMLQTNNLQMQNNGSQCAMPRSYRLNTS